MIGGTTERTAHECRERLDSCEMRVSALCLAGGTADWQRRADTLTRSLLHASQTHNVRLRYESDVESRIGLSLSLTSDRVPVDWANLEAALQCETGFAFERVGAGTRDKPGRLVTLEPPSFRVAANRPVTIGFGKRISTRRPAMALLPLPPLVQPGAIDAAVSLAVAGGRSD